MIYNDYLYGKISLPDYIGELIESPLVQRLKDISQGVLPQSMIPWNLPSRFEHSVGVCHLMNQVLKSNNLKFHEPLLLVSALLHDAGNPALSHLSEPFLKKFNGKNGESFLKDTILKFANTRLFDSLCITSEEVISVVTGNNKPLSEILHGSMDVDNLDNVLRYWYKTTGEKRFDAESIARSYRFEPAMGLEGLWFLMSNCQEETKKWQGTRKDVYAKIYGEPDLNAAIMIYRAVYLAQELGEINEEFFHLSDTEAIQYLLNCNEWTSHLARRMIKHEWYPLVYSLETTEPSDSLVQCIKLDGFRSAVADYICEQLKIPNGMIGAYVGKGKDARSIHMPFINSDGHLFLDDSDSKTIYRFKIYIDPDYTDKTTEVRFWANYMIK